MTGTAYAHSALTQSFLMHVCMQIQTIAQMSAEAGKHHLKNRVLWLGD